MLHVQTSVRSFSLHPVLVGLLSSARCVYKPFPGLLVCSHAMAFEAEDGCFPLRERTSSVGSTIFSARKLTFLDHSQLEATSFCARVSRMMNMDLELLDSRLKRLNSVLCKAWTFCYSPFF